MITAAAGALSPPPKRGNPDSYHTAKASRSKNYTANNSNSGENNQLSFSDVRVAAYGQWEYIHTALGVKIISTDYRKHTACCGCGGKDRFRVMADYGNTGKWFCGGGGDQQSGDGFALLEHVFGWDSKQQLKAVADVLGLTKLDDSERIKMRVKISAFGEKQAEYNRKKAHSMNRNRNIKELAEDLLDAVKRKEYFQRLADKAGSFDIIQDTQLEYDILKAIRKIYADEYKPNQEVNHA